jgi:hypothetical protein
MIFLISISLFGCSLLPKEEQVVQMPPKAPKEEKLTVPEIIKKERLNLFDLAEGKLKEEKLAEALELYLKITREAHNTKDIVYDKSLLRIAEIYEKTDQSEKSILALEELNLRNTPLLDPASKLVLLMKNHYRVTNYHQADQLRSELNQLYKARKIGLTEIYKALFYQTDLYYDRHILDESEFVGNLQKFFVYVMESDMTEEAEKLTDLLIHYYNGFLNKLDSPQLSGELKKKLIISLLDQFGKFDRYKLTDTRDEVSQLQRFSSFAEQQQRKLTERLIDGKY